MWWLGSGSLSRYQRSCWCQNLCRNHLQQLWFGVLLLPVKAQRCFHGFGKLICLPAEPEVLNGDVGLLPSGVVLSVLRTEALFWKCWGILKDPSKSRFG